jgi:hypothetical protein
MGTLLWIGLSVFAVFAIYAVIVLPSMIGCMGLSASPQSMPPLPDKDNNGCP